MKNNMISRLAQTILALLVPLAAAGQDLNPTVEVSKEYEGKLIEAHKPQFRMAVPDSVYRFDLDFDYSVGKTPYKGAYEFSPYTVELAPEPVVRDFKSLYLKAGIGYQLHPELDFVWTPEFSRSMQMNVWLSHNSFVGRYWNLALKPGDDFMSKIGRVGKDHEGGRSWGGYDSGSEAGVEGRYDWDNAVMRFRVSGESILQKDKAADKRSFLGVGAKAEFASKQLVDGFGYSVGAGYHYAEDYISGPLQPGAYVKEHDVDLDGVLKFSVDTGHTGMFDIGFDVVNMSGMTASGGVDIDLVPHYLMELGRWRLDLGFRYSTAFKASSSSESYGYFGQLFYPAVKIEYMLIRNAMKVYLDLGGDSKLVSYSDIVNHNRRANMFYGRGVNNILDSSEEKINATLGFEGRVGKRFSYDVNGGFSSMGNAPLEGIVMRDGVMLPTLGYSSYSKAFASASWMLDLEDIRFDGALDYSYLFNMENKYVSGLFFPPALKGDVSLSYKWRKRVKASLDCEFSSARKGSVAVPGQDHVSYVIASLPAYADLGLNAEYVVNRKLSVWLRGGNLLGMTIQRSILYAEKGPYFTAGVYLNL